MKAVQFGAGNIGRGFIGQLFRESGYEVVFVEVVPHLIEKLNTDRCYPVRVVSPTSSREILIDHVRAVNGTDLEAVASELAEADIAATAVGVNVLSKIAGPIALGLRKRWSLGNRNPLNIIICENLLEANHYLQNLILQELDTEEQVLFHETVGLVEASIGRMVPVMTEAMQEGNPLRIWVEEYSELPVDRDGFKGPLPPVKHMIPFSPFRFYIERKLFVHNAGHAMVAYLGHLKNYTCIWEATMDPDIVTVCRKALEEESAGALSREHSVPLQEIKQHIQDLLYRFSNRSLGDTIARVGKDPVRKLSSQDRLIGACKLALKHGITPENLSMGAAAAMLFYREDDPSSGRIRSLLQARGPEGVLEEICGLLPGEPLWDLILQHYRQLRR